MFREAIVDALDAYRFASGPDDPVWKRYNDALVTAASEESFAISVAMQFLESDEPARKHVALDLCLRIAEHNPDAVAAHAMNIIATVLDEHDVALRISAVTALGVARASDAVPFLLGCLDSSSTELRAPSALALSSCAHASKSAMRATIAATSDDDAEVRMCAVLGLAARVSEPDNNVLDAMAKRLFDVDDAVREEAILGLARHGDQRAVPAVVAAIEGPNPSDRMLHAGERLGLGEL